MKKNLLKSLVALVLILALLALASCTGNISVSDGNEENGDTITTDNNENESNNETQNNNENETVVDAYAVTFVTDEHCSITVYTTQDMTGAGEENATVAYSINKDTGLPTKEEEAGQVNFVVVLEEGYEIDNISATPTESYNKLKSGVEETGVETGYRITKIKGDLTVTVTTKIAGTAENLENGYAVTFVVDEHASVTIFKTQDMTTEGEENATIAYSRNSTTGDLTKENGQVNFLVVLEEGYEIDNVSAVGGYKNLKGFEDTSVENGYRLTKITGEVTVTITTKEIETPTEDPTETPTEDPGEAPVETGYTVTFVTDAFASVTVYPTQDLTADGEENALVAYSRDGDTGALLNDGNGQVNFVVVLEEGYEIDSITATEGTYKNIKDLGSGAWRITKITADTTVTITAKLAAPATEV